MRQGRWPEFVNNTGETIPAFAAIMVRSAAKEGTLLTDAPTSRMPLIALKPAGGLGEADEGSDDTYPYDPPSVTVGFFKSALTIALNGEHPVIEGDKGLCTFEMPAWGLIRDDYMPTVAFGQNIPIPIDASNPPSSSILTIAVPTNGQWYLTPATATNDKVSPSFDWTGTTELLDVFRIVTLLNRTPAVAGTLVALLMREDRL